MIKNRNMLKKEIIYREILTKALEEKQINFKQLSLAKKFGFSLSTINHALKPLASIGAIEIGRRGFKLTDIKKALLYWATIRKFDKDIVYSTRMEERISEIERSVPASAIYTCYTGYKLLFKDVPADYSEIYFYLPKEDLEEAKQRFPPKKGPANVSVLNADQWLRGYKIAPAAQIYVDLWNLKTWYAGDFVKALEERLRI